MPKPKDTLDSIDIKSPCTADWDEMVGNEQVRFCRHCNLSVHDFSAMTRKEAMRLIIKSKGKLCARYVRRPDGRVQTTDLVLHQISAVKRRVSRLAAGAFTAALSISASVAAAAPVSAQTTGEAVASTQMIQGRLKINHGSGATLTGTIKDPNGAVIAGATARLVNEISEFEQTTTTNDEGVYLFQGVEEGSYTLRLEAAGLASKEVNNIILRAGEEQSMDETLEITGAMSGAIVVTTPEQPLLSAVLTDDVDEVKRLLAAGADVNVLDDGIDSTALAQAVQRDNRELVNILLNAGADVNQKNSEGETALMYLSGETSVEIVQDLLAAGAKIDLANEEGQNPLHRAAGYTNTEVLQALIDAGARIDATDESGRTALMLAAEDGNEDNVAALLKAGASVNLRDEEDKTAFGLAKENDHNEVCDLLASYGGGE